MQGHPEAKQGGVFWCSDQKSTEEQFRIVVEQGLQIVERQSVLAPGQMNTPYSMQFHASGGV